MSNYLGRPSAGDSPFAIGQKAFFDTSTPQAPSQRNPTPRGQPAMATPQPYGGGGPGQGGDVSGEARRRYEERYKKKQEEERLKAQQSQGQGGQAGPGGQGQGGPGGSGGQGVGHQGGQVGGYQGGSGSQYQQPPPQQRPPPQQQQSFGPGPVPPGGYPHSPQPQFTQTGPPQWSGYSSTSPQPQQSPHSTHGSLHPQHQPSRSSFDQSRPPPQPQQSYGPPPPQGQQLYDRPMQSPPIQQQQRWSQSSGQQQQGGPQWSQKAAPPPPQDFRGRPGSAQSHNPGQGQSQQMGQGPSSQGHSQVASVHASEQGDEELRMMFEQFDSSRSGQLHSFDLQRLLAKDSLMEDPREDAVKMLMNIFDTDRSGSINFMEFEGLYRYIQDWHGIFQRFDRDASGLIDRKELHQALLGFGFSLPAEMVRKLEKRFAPPPKLLPGGQVVPRKGISFDRFLMACVTVKHYTEGFRKMDPNNTGQITVDYNSFMEMVLDAP